MQDRSGDHVQLPRCSSDHFDFLRGYQGEMPRSVLVRGFKDCYGDTSCHPWMPFPVTPGLVRGDRVDTPGFGESESCCHDVVDDWSVARIDVLDVSLVTESDEAGRSELDQCALHCSGRALQGLGYALDAREGSVAELVCAICELQQHSEWCPVASAEREIGSPDVCVEAHDSGSSLKRW